MRKIIKNKNRGFTIVELIVVMAIIAILILIAVPAYTKYIDNAKRTSELGTEDTIYKATITALSDDYLSPESEKSLVTPGAYAFKAETNGNLEAEIEEGVSGMTPKTADMEGVIVYGYDENLYQPGKIVFANNVQDKWRVLIKSTVDSPSPTERGPYPIDIKGDVYIVSPEGNWYKNGDPTTIPVPTE